MDNIPIPNWYAIRGFRQNHNVFVIYTAFHVMTKCGLVVEFAALSRAQGKKSCKNCLDELKEPGILHKRAKQKRSRIIRKQKKYYKNSK